MSTVLAVIVGLLVGYVLGRVHARPRQGYQPRSNLVLDLSSLKPPPGGSGVRQPERKR